MHLDMEIRLETMRQIYKEMRADYKAVTRVISPKQDEARIGDSGNEGMLADVKTRVDLLARLKGGADFAELARVHSEDGSAARGGDLGWLYPGDTAPDFERAMDALKPGEISQPVKTQFGWHLIQVLGRRTAGMTPERMRLQAREALRERKSDEAYQEWLRKLRDETYVEIHLGDQ